MAQVQVRRGRVHAQLDPEFPAGLQLPDKFFFDQQLVGAAADEFEGLREWGHLDVKNCTLSSCFNLGEVCYTPPRIKKTTLVGAACA
jgi:hypothetical protein